MFTYMLLYFLLLCTLYFLFYFGSLCFLYAQDFCIYCFLFTKNVLPGGYYRLGFFRLASFTRTLFRYCRRRKFRWTLEFVKLSTRTCLDRRRQHLTRLKTRFTHSCKGIRTRGTCRSLLRTLSILRKADCSNGIVVMVASWNSRSVRLGS